MDNNMSLYINECEMSFYIIKETKDKIIFVYPIAKPNEIWIDDLETTNSINGIKSIKTTNLNSTHLVWSDGKIPFSGDIKIGELIAMVRTLNGSGVAIRFGRITQILDNCCMALPKFTIVTEPPSYINGEIIDRVRYKYMKTRIQSRIRTISQQSVDYTAMYQKQNDNDYKLKGINMFDNSTRMPTINKVIINNPSVIVFWSDGDKTIGKAINSDTFDPQIGFAMAISKKYYSCLGYQYPRAAFKNSINKYAIDYSLKTIDKKSKKKNKEKTND